MDEIVDVSTAQTDTIADILYNTCHRWSKWEFAPAMCYIPRNAILFLDSAGEIFAFIEICFECERMRLSSKEIFLDEYICDYTYTGLRTFFSRLGLKTSATELLDREK